MATIMTTSILLPFNNRSEEGQGQHFMEIWISVSILRLLSIFNDRILFLRKKIKIVILWESRIEMLHLIFWFSKWKWFSFLSFTNEMLFGW